MDSVIPGKWGLSLESVRTELKSCKVSEAGSEERQRRQRALPQSEIKERSWKISNKEAWKPGHLSQRTVGFNVRRTNPNLTDIVSQTGLLILKPLTTKEMNKLSRCWGKEELWEYIEDGLHLAIPGKNAKPGNNEGQLRTWYNHSAHCSPAHGITFSRLWERAGRRVMGFVIRRWKQWAASCRQEGPASWMNLPGSILLQNLKRNVKRVLIEKVNWTHKLVSWIGRKTGVLRQEPRYLWRRVNL